MAYFLFLIIVSPFCHSKFIILFNEISIPCCLNQSITTIPVANKFFFNYENDKKKTVTKLRNKTEMSVKLFPHVTPCEVGSSDLEANVSLNQLHI